MAIVADFLLKNIVLQNVVPLNVFAKIISTLYYPGSEIKQKDKRIAQESWNSNITYQTEAASPK